MPFLEAKKLPPLKSFEDSIQLEVAKNVALGRVEDCISWRPGRLSLLKVEKFKFV
jgi:hypothetical protein